MSRYRPPRRLPWYAKPTKYEARRRIGMTRGRRKRLLEQHNAERKAERKMARLSPETPPIPQPEKVKQWIFRMTEDHFMEHVVFPLLFTMASLVWIAFFVGIFFEIFQLSVK